MRQDPPETTPERGTCYGFRVLSSESFVYLREGGGTPFVLTEATRERPPSTGTLLARWETTAEPREEIRLHENDDGYVVEMGEVHWFSVAPDGSGVVMGPPDCGPHRESLLWATPAAVAMTRRGDLVLHAAAVEIEGRALLLVGPTHAGKTTTAAAFLNAGHRLLSDDLISCRTDGELRVPPGPALVRLRPDAAERITPPGVSVSLRTPDRVHLALDAEIRGSGEPVPLGGVCLLAVSEGGPELSRVPSEEAVRALWPTSFFLRDGRDLERSFRAIARLADEVPIWHVSRRLDWATLPGLVDRLAERVRAA